MGALHKVVAHFIFLPLPTPTGSGSPARSRIGIGVSELAAMSAGDAIFRPAPAVTLSAMIADAGVFFPHQRDA